MKKSILLAIAALAAAINLNAQTEPLFRAKEFSVRLAVLNPMDIGTQDTFDAKAASLAGFEAGMGYYFTRYLGAEVNVPVWRSDNRCFQSVSAGVMARLPLDAIFPDAYIPNAILMHVAPYARAGVGRSECWTSPWSIYAGGGVEVRFNRTFGVFGGVVYSRRGAFAPDSWGVWRPEAGLRLAF